MVILMPVFQIRKLEEPALESWQFGSRVCAPDDNALLLPLREGSLSEEA